VKFVDKNLIIVVVYVDDQLWRSGKKFRKKLKVKIIKDFKMKIVA